jgi:hypothetical protein
MRIKPPSYPAHNNHQTKGWPEETGIVASGLPDPGVVRCLRSVAEDVQDVINGFGGGDGGKQEVKEAEWMAQIIPGMRTVLGRSFL